MSAAKNALQMYEEMLARGFFSATSERQLFEMPSVLRSVPTFTTYGTSTFPIFYEGNFSHAELEERVGADSSRARKAD